MNMPLDVCSRVLVVGVWGAGKTTVGHWIAGELGWPMQDADTVIGSFADSVRASDTSALEERSRRLRAVVRDRSIKEIVIATTMRPLLNQNGELDPATEHAIKSSRCAIIELRRDLTDIADLLYKDPLERFYRPHLQGATAGEIREELHQLEQSLAPVYERYRTGVVTVTGKSCHEIADAIKVELAKTNIARCDDSAAAEAEFRLIDNRRI